jgi:signal recognition particle subunit SRP19
MGKKGGKVRVKQMGSKAPKGMMNPMDALAIPPEEMIHLPPSPDRSYQMFWPIRKYIAKTY